eukprot:1160821-Pelagomonas_calceolata.AAC.13
MEALIYQVMLQTAGSVIERLTACLPQGTKKGGEMTTTVLQEQSYTREYPATVLHQPPRDLEKRSAICAPLSHDFHAPPPLAPITQASPAPTAASHVRSLKGRPTAHPTQLRFSSTSCGWFVEPKLVRAMLFNPLQSVWLVLVEAEQASLAGGWNVTLCMENNRSNVQGVTFKVSTAA